MAQVLNQKVVGDATDDNVAPRTCETQSRINSAKKIAFENNVRRKAIEDPIAFTL